MATTDIRHYERLCTAGLVVGLVSAGSGMMNLLMRLVLAGLITSGMPAEAYIQPLATNLVVLVIIALAWRRPFIGGAALIIVWLVRMVLSIVLSLDSIRMIFEYGLWSTWMVPTVIDLLIPVSGVLFLLAGRRTQTITTEGDLKSAESMGRHEKLRLAGLITGSMVGILYIQRTGASIAGLVFPVAGLVIFSSVALGWRRPLTCGIVLIVESLWPLAILAASPLFPSSEALGLAMLWGLMPAMGTFMCLPLLASGVLFLLLWREERKVLSGGASAEGYSRQD